MTDPTPKKPPHGKALNKKQLYWYGGAGLAALAAIWYVMRRRGAQTQAIPPEDMSGYSAAGGGYQQAGYYDPGTGAFIGGTGAGGVGTIFGPSTNAAWAQQAEAYLVSIGYDAVATGGALGKYLTGQTMTDDQKTIVQSALAFFGAPPVAAPPISSAPPGGQTNEHPGFTPPDLTTGPGIGQAGNYWWTPTNEEQAANFALLAYTSSGHNPNPANEAGWRSRIMQLNPQIDWSQDFRSLINKPLFIPAVTIGGTGGAHTEAPWALPSGATLRRPGSNPPPAP